MGNRVIMIHSNSKTSTAMIISEARSHKNSRLFSIVVVASLFLFFLTFLSLTLSSSVCSWSCLFCDC